MKTNNPLPFEIRKKGTSNEEIASQLAQNMNQSSKSAKQFYPSIKHLFSQISFDAKRKEGTNLVPAPFNVAFIGDSLPGYLALPIVKASERKYGLTGLGFDPFSNSRYGTSVTLTKSAGWTTFLGDITSQEKWGMGGNSINGNAGESLSYKPIDRFPFARFRIWFAKKTGGGIFTYSVDGGTATSVDTNGASGLGYVDVNIGGNTANKSHQIDISVTSGNATLYGIETYSNNMSGMCYHWLNTGGTRAFQWAGKTDYLQPYFNVSIPDVVVLWLGANDAMAEKRTADQYYTDINTVLNSLNLPSTCDIILLTHFGKGLSGVEDTAYRDLVAQYRTKIFAIAKEKDLSIFDIKEYFPPFASANNLGLYSDDVHPSDKGAAYLSVALSDLFGYGSYEFAGLDSENVFTKKCIS
jgi:hypothetical protein